MMILEGYTPSLPILPQLISHPHLIQRPIVINETTKHGIIARPPELVWDIVHKGELM